MIYEAHKPLMNKIEKTGYAVSGGICYGFSSAAIMSLLCGGMEEFIKILLITYISNEEIENLIFKLKVLEKLTATGEIIAEEELKKYHLTAKELEWLAFCDAVMLAHITGHYAYLFNKGQKIAFQDFLSSSQFTLPFRFTVDNKNDFLDLIASFSGAYQHNDLVSYFSLFEAQIKKKEIESFGLQLISSNHAIAVAFDAKTTQWYLIDANKMPPYSIALGNAEELADFVLTSLSKNENAIFQTHIYTKNSTSKPIKDLFDKVKQEIAWKSLHEINQNKVHRLDSIDANWLYTASVHGDYDVANVLIKSGADVNYVCNGVSPIWIASQNGHANVVKLLLEHGADVTHANKNGVTPLWIASEKGHVDVVELLLVKNADLATQLDYGVSPIWIASHNGHRDAVKLLIEKGRADVDQVCNGFSLLYIASQKGHADVVKLLIDTGANVNQLCNGVSPLWAAAQHGHVDVVKLLLAKDVEVNQLCNSVSPLWIASSKGHADVVKLLIDTGANVNQLCNGVSPLWEAVKNGHDDVAELLIQKNADINKAHNNGATLLFIAAQNGHIKIVQALLKCKGIQIDIPFKSDKKSLENFSKKQGLNIQKIMTQWIKTRQPENQQYAMTARDIADIMGHNDIVQELDNYQTFVQMNQQSECKQNIVNYSVFGASESKNTSTPSLVSLSQ